MKQNITFLLFFITLISYINAGVIKNRSSCFDVNGNEIPCIKMVSKGEDFGIKTINKRQWGWGNIQWNNNNNNWKWWNRNNGNNGNNVSNYAVSNAASEDYSQSNENKQNNWNDWFNKDNQNSVWRWLNKNNRWNNFWNKNSNTWNNGNSWNNKNNDNYNNGYSNVSNNNIHQENPSSNNVNVPEQTIQAPQPSSVPEQTTEVPPSSNTPEQTTEVPPSYSTPEQAIEVPAPSNAQEQTIQAPSSSIPIKDFTMTGFKNCDASQTETLKSLTEDIKTYRAAAVYLLSHQQEDEMYNKIFLKFYKDNSVFEKVQQTFNNLNNMSNAAAYCETDEDDACADGALAWTYLGSSEFHVCPSFFTKAMFGTIEQRMSEASSIVLHELTHCHGTDDFAYGEQGCQTLDAEHAKNNADTFRLFAMSSIYYLNEKNKYLNKRNDDFLNESIDFRPEPFTDKVITLPKEVASQNEENLVKRNAEDFLNESIDFRPIPFVDKVVEPQNQQEI